MANKDELFLIQRHNYLLDGFTPGTDVLSIMNVLKLTALDMGVSELMTKRELLSATQEEILEEAKKLVTTTSVLQDINNYKLPEDYQEVVLLKDKLNVVQFNNIVLISAYNLAVLVTDHLRKYNLIPHNEVTLISVSAEHSTFVLTL